MRKSNVSDFLGTYSRLVDYPNAQQKEAEFLGKKELHYAKKTNFTKIPGMPIAYWVSKKMIKAFEEIRIQDVAEVITGISTGNNAECLRNWYEVDLQISDLSYCDKRNLSFCDIKWIPYNKGGDVRKWFGNNEYVVNWSKSQSFHRPRPMNAHLYFKQGITWSFVTSGMFSARYYPEGFLWDVAGSPCIPEQGKMNYVLGYLSTNIANHILKILNPTINCQVVDIQNMPIIFVESKTQDINLLVDNCIRISTQDWDSFETSWDFQKHPLIAYKTISSWEGQPLSGRIKQAFENWKAFKNQQFDQLKKNEEELNRIFIDIYDLAEELTPEVEEKDVTVYRVVENKDELNYKSNYILERSDVIKSFISYAVGCMLGRYSPYKDGLIYAGGNWDYHKLQDELWKAAEKTYGSKTRTII